MSELTGQASSMSRTISAGLTVDRRGNLLVLEGLDALRERVVQRLHFVLGEWFLVQSEGVPFAETIFAWTPDHRLTAQVISSELMRVGGVTGIESIGSSLDPATRRLQVTLEVQTTFGTIQVDEEV